MVKYTNKNECTLDQELMADAAAYALGRCSVCTHQVAALFCVKLCPMATIYYYHHSTRKSLLTLPSHEG